MKKFKEWSRTPLGKAVLLIISIVLLAPLILLFLGIFTTQQCLNVLAIYVAVAGLIALSPLYIAAIVMGGVYFGKMLFEIWNALKWCYSKICKN